jgi:hypothetical protein
MSFIGNLLGDITGTTQQAQAAEKASAQQVAAQQAAFQQVQQNLSPYAAVGTSVLPQLLTSLGYQGQYGSNGQLTGVSGQGFQFNPSNLAQTPGYQFTLQQGLNAVNNQQAAMGLNNSGAQGKALANYATGLAQNTYNQQYQNALSTYQTNAQQLGSLLSLGQNAAAGVGNVGYQSQSAIGNAQAAGTVAGGNTQTNAISSLLGLGQGAAGIYALGNLGGANSLNSAISSLFGSSGTANAINGAGSLVNTGEISNLPAYLLNAAAAV